MKTLFFTAILFSIFPAMISAATPTERKLVLQQTIDGRRHISEVFINNKSPGELFKFNLSGFFKKWKCSGWLKMPENEIVVDCSPVGEIWRALSTVRCDSKDTFFLDAVDMKCQGK